jgi:hypothetical protein
MAQSRFQQTLVDGKIVESRDGGATRVLARSYISRGGALVSLRDGIGAGLKWATRLVYVSPALIVARLIVHGMDARKGEWIVAGFVGIVVLFFVMLSFYLFAAFIAWGQTQRSALDRPSDVEEEEGATDADAADAGMLVTITGRATRLDATDMPLLADFWRSALRITEASVFGVTRDNGSPVVVLATTAPFVLGHAVGRDAASVLSALTIARTEVVAGQEGESLIVAEGDEITVTGQLLDRIANIAEFELDGEMYRWGAGKPDAETPYRQTSVQGGLLVSDTVTAPLVVRVGKK